MRALYGRGMVKVKKSNSADGKRRHRCRKSNFRRRRRESGEIFQAQATRTIGRER
jgi:hypothetical protein